MQEICIECCNVVLACTVCMCTEENLSKGLFSFECLVVSFCVQQYFELICILYQFLFWPFSACVPVLSAPYCYCGQTITSTATVTVLSVWKNKHTLIRKTVDKKRGPTESSLVNHCS